MPATRRDALRFSALAAASALGITALSDTAYAGELTDSFDPILNGFHYASESHSELPSIQTAIDNVDKWGTVVIVPGTHEITDTVVVDKRMNIEHYGRLTKAADVDLMRIEENIGYYGAPTRRTLFHSAIDDTTDGVVFAEKSWISGVLSASGNGRHGVLFDSTINSRGNFNEQWGRIRADGNGKDGVRFDVGSDGNGMDWLVNARNNGRHGVRFENGFANTIRMPVLEGNGEYGLSVYNNANDNRFFIGDAEGNGAGSAEIDTSANSCIDNFLQIQVDRDGLGDGWNEPDTWGNIAFTDAKMGFANMSGQATVTAGETENISPSLNYGDFYQLPWLTVEDANDDFELIFKLTRDSSYNDQPRWQVTEQLGRTDVDVRWILRGFPHAP